MMLFLDEEHVRKHLRMADLIPAMEKALIDFSAGKVTQPVRQVIPVDPPGGFYGMMPALTPEGLGQKIVTFYPPNTERGIPTHMATILLNDPQTGAPLAVMDGRLITEMRTAAVSQRRQNFSRQRIRTCSQSLVARASAQPRGSAATGETIRRDSRLESKQIARGAVRERDRRESDVS